jgi:hypothetical protein
MQQLVVNEVTSTAPTADLEQPTEVPLNSSTFMFLSLLCYIMNFSSVRGRNTKDLQKKDTKNGNLGLPAYMLLSWIILGSDFKNMILSCRPMQVPRAAEFMQARLMM